MQVKKNNIRKKFLNIAKKEFIRKGYNGTTIRTIAKKSGIAVGNLYNYFKNKDKIFEEILSPTINKIKNALETMKNKKISKNDSEWSFEWHKEQLKQIIKFVDLNRDELNLIIFQSHGSAVENFKDYVVERYTDIVCNNFKFIKNKYPEINTNISRFFMHNIASFYANIITELLMHNKSYKEMLKYSDELSTFSYYGFKALMKW